MSQMGKFVDLSSISAIGTLTGNSGGAVSPDGSSNIDIVGSGAIDIVGNPAAWTLTVSIADASTTTRGSVELATDAETIAGSDSVRAVVPSALAAKLGTQTDHGVLVGSGSSAAITALSVGTNGQVLLGSTGADPVFATLTSSGATITFTPGPGTLNLEAAAGAGNFPDNTFYVYESTDNTRRLAFECSGISGSTTRTITMDDRDIDMDAVATTVATDSGNAVPAAGTLTVAGGTNLNSAGAGSTATINLDASISAMTAVDFAAGGRIGTATGAGNTLLLRAYDVDGAAYTTFATLTANNTPTMDLDDAVTKGGQYIYRAAGTDVPVTDGGTGVSSLTDHGVVLGSGAAAVSVTAVGATGEVLKGNTGADPTWAAVDLTADVTGTLPVTNGGTGAATLTDGGILLGSGTGAVTALAQPTNGQLPIGSTGSDPVMATLTEGSNITITNGAGTITIASTASGGISWNEVTGTSQTASVDNGYICNNASLVTVTLPDTAALGSVVAITGKGAGGWKVAQNAGETIHWDESNATTTGATGYLQSTDDYDSVRLICITANTTWGVLSSKGNITIA